MELKNSPNGNSRPLVVVVLGFVLLAGIGLVSQIEHPNQVCLIDKNLYTLAQRSKLRANFQSYLGSPSAIDWTRFSSALETYLSEAYRSCNDQSDTVKSCVRIGLDRIEKLLANEEGLSPKERWHALLTLEGPRYCAQEKPQSSPNSDHELKAWHEAVQNKYEEAEHRLALLIRANRPELSDSNRSATGTSSASVGLKTIPSQAFTTIVARVDYNHGVILLRLKEDKAAVRRFELGLKGADGEARLHYGMALSRLRLGEFESALTQLTTAKTLHPMKMSTLDPLGLNIGLGLAAAYRGLRKFVEADELIELLIEAASSTLNKDHELIGRLNYELAWIRADRRRYGEAQKFLRRALGVWKKQYGDAHPNLVDAKIAMALAQIEGGIPDDALTTLKQAQLMHEKLGGGELQAIEIEFLFALAYSDTDAYLDRAMEIASKALFRLRDSELKHSALESSIQRWLEAI